VGILFISKYWDRALLEFDEDRCEFIPLRSFRIANEDADLNFLEGVVDRFLPEPVPIWVIGTEENEPKTPSVWIALVEETASQEAESARCWRFGNGVIRHNLSNNIVANLSPPMMRMHQ